MMTWTTALASTTETHATHFNAVSIVFFPSLPFNIPYLICINKSGIYSCVFLLLSEIKLLFFFLVISTFLALDRTIEEYVFSRVHLVSFLVLMITVYLSLILFIRSLIRFVPNEHEDDGLRFRI